MLPTSNPAFTALQSGLRAVQQHPRQVMLAVLGLLGGFALTAVAIAPLATDPAALPQRVLTEVVPVQGLGQQLDVLASHDLELHRSTVSRDSDSADSLLRRLGVIDPLAASFLRSDLAARRLLDGQGGKMVQARSMPDGTLMDLTARFPATDPAQAATHFSRLKLVRAGGHFMSHLESVPLQAQVRLGSGKVRGTIWQAAEQARLPEGIATQLVDIFSGHIDLHRNLRNGDSFSVVFEALTADGEPITWNEGTGRVLAAEFVNKGKRHQAVWYTDPDTGRGAYFSMDGQSRQRPFLASPLPFSRVTSGFAMRIHPILQNLQAHNGVDYAAPVGTPVMTVGDGTVGFAGRQSGYGNVVEVKHNGGRSTLYAHLSTIGVRVGDTVTKGQVVGEVGATGMATGPHLHFEFRVNGQFIDPALVIEASDVVTIERTERPRFQQLATAVRAQLQAAESMTAFRGDAE